MVRITRREFMKYCSIAAGALGLSASTMMKLEQAMAKPTANGGTPVIWMAGAACTGCTTSLANTRFYTTIDDLLLNTLDLRYHDTLMSAAGAYVDGSQWGGTNAIAESQAMYAASSHTAPGYVLVVEGAVQTGASGDYCHIGKMYSQTGGETMLENVRALADHAIAVLCVGTCSSFGGIPAARGNLTGATSVYNALESPVGSMTSAERTRRQENRAKVVNIPGCPPHPDWIVGTIAHIISTNITIPPLDSNRRPVDYGYGEYQCNAGPCTWRYNNTNSRTNNNNVFAIPPDYNNRYPEGNSRALGKNKWNNMNDVGCLGILGCKGRKTKADCSRRRWNTDEAESYGVNWCVGSRAGCHGCTEPTFPDRVGKFFTIK